VKGRAANNVVPSIAFLSTIPSFRVEKEAWFEDNTSVQKMNTILTKETLHTRGNAVGIVIINFEQYLSSPCLLCEVFEFGFIRSYLHF
jgi:hypothetical protein